MMRQLARAKAEVEQDARRIERSARGAASGHAHRAPAGRRFPRDALRVHPARRRAPDRGAGSGSRGAAEEGRADAAAVSRRVPGKRAGFLPVRCRRRRAGPKAGSSSVASLPVDSPHDLTESPARIERVARVAVRVAPPGRSSAPLPGVVAYVRSKLMLSKTFRTSNRNSKFMRLPVSNRFGQTDVEPREPRRPDEQRAWRAVAVPDLDAVLAVGRRDVAALRHAERRVAGRRRRIRAECAARVLDDVIRQHGHDLRGSAS